MAVFNDITSLIGNTPLVRLTKLFPEHNIFAKLEGNNLTGSMKARSALGMITAAEERGELQPGMEIIESTSGNLGYALAAIGALKGYEVTLVIDPKTDELKRNMLKAYGAKLVIIDKPDEYGAYQPARMEMVEKLLKIKDNSWSTKQYSNLDNMMAHYNTLGPEIYEDLGGKIDILIGAIGTCGHLGGSAKYLKEKIPNLRIVGVQPVGSSINGGAYKPYLVQGPGLSFSPSNYDPETIKEIVDVCDEDSFYCARELAKTQAILSGGSAGSVIYTVKDLISKQSINNEENVVMILADDGFRYAANFFDDKWMIDHGMRPDK